MLLKVTGYLIMLHKERLGIKVEYDEKKTVESQTFRIDEKKI